MCDLYYRIMIISIIIINLGQILLSYIAHTHSHTRAGTHARTPPSPFRLSLFDGSVAPMTEYTPPFAGSAGDQWPVAGSLK